MNDKDKQPTSGFVSDIGDESDFNSTRHNGGFTNISEAYVSNRALTAFSLPFVTASAIC